jgi:hypothetical protein
MREHGQLRKKELADVVEQVLELNLAEAPGEEEEDAYRGGGGGVQTHVAEAPGDSGEDGKGRRQQVDAATVETEATGKGERKATGNGERKQEGTDEQQAMIMSYVNNNPI